MEWKASEVTQHSERRDRFGQEGSLNLRETSLLTAELVDGAPRNAFECARLEMQVLAEWAAIRAS